MRLSIATTALAAVLAAACSSSPPPRPADSSNVRNFGPGSGIASTTTAPAAFRWHTRLADAQADAQRTGRLILATSTRPGCTLCERFKDQVVPATQPSLAPVAVGYLYEIERPESPMVDQTLRANLRGATHMPLVGFLSPELQYVHGFSGATTAGRFQSDIAAARRVYPTGVARVPATPGGDNRGMAAVTNEFGEREWGLPGDVWSTGDVEPEDAITGRPNPAGTPPTAPPAGPVNPPPMGPVTPTTPPMPSGPPAGPVTPTIPPSTPVTPAAPTGTTPSGPANPPFHRPAQPAWSKPSPNQAPPSTRPLPGPAPTSGPDTTTPSTRPVPPFSTRPEPGADLSAWGKQSLQRALDQIRATDYAGARQTLSEIQRRMPGTIMAREAAKGSVAIYNHKRLRATTGAQQDRLRARAQRDLGSTMWGELFR